MKKKTLYFLLSLFITSEITNAQSVFSGKPLQFSIYTFDNNNDTIQFEKLSNLDTLRTELREINIDKNEVVKWTEFPINFFNYNHLKKTIGGFLKKSEYYSNSPITFAFKVHKTGDGFYYQTIDSSKTVLFEAHLSKEKPLTDVPFFVVNNYGLNTLEAFEGLTYNKDTTIFLGNTKVPCHLYVSSKNSLGKHSDIFGVSYCEVFFDIKSLLPIVISNRTISRVKSLGETEKFILTYRRTVISPSYP